MPIYEFYCQGCHRVFQFFSSRVDTEAAPDCPRCGRERLPRKPATFSTLRRSAGEGAGDKGEEDALFGDMDEERMAGAFEAILAEAETGGESEDPRATARLLRRFGEAAGLEPGERMEEMLQRLEAGEDPDRLEEEMGGESEGDEDLSDFFRAKRALAGRRSQRPPVDSEIYFL